MLSSNGDVSIRGEDVDTMSSLFPDRPIRPLPARFLRSRLSPDAVNTSNPHLPNSKPTSAPNVSQQMPGRWTALPSQWDCGCNDPDVPEASCPHHRDETYVSGDDQDPRYVDLLASRYVGPNGDRNGVVGAGFVGSRIGPVRSTASSVDGYDSLENSNNKKKRKIPANSSNNSTQLSDDFGNLGISSSADRDDTFNDVSGNEHFYDAYSGLPGMSPLNGTSGPGRGRIAYSKALWKSGKSQASPSYTWGSGPIASAKLAHLPSQGEPGILGEWIQSVAATHEASRSSQHADIVVSGKQSAESSEGIIAAAIANASSPQSRLPVPKGQENVSLLQQYTSANSTTVQTSPPTQSQFTFSYDSPVASHIASSPHTHFGQTNTTHLFDDATGLPLSLQANPRSPQSYHPSQAGIMATQGTQTSPNLARALDKAAQGLAAHQSRMPPPPQPQYRRTSGQQRPAPLPADAQQQAAPKKSRRRRGEQYARAAQDRRMNQAYNNYNNPPQNPEDVWICEFCEYESIFGCQPEALIRQYEVKDKVERRRLAEKRRLLEKAKMKGRKQKKGAKGQKNAAPPPTPAPNPNKAQPSHQQYQPQPGYDGSYDDPGSPLPDGYWEQEAMSSKEADSGSYPLKSKVDQKFAQLDQEYEAKSRLVDQEYEAKRRQAVLAHQAHINAHALTEAQQGKKQQPRAKAGA